MMWLGLVIGLAVGATLGAAVAWRLVSWRARAKSSEELARSEGRALEAEGVVEELRKQIEKADEDFQSARTTLDDERQFKVKAETQLAEASRYYQEQKALLEEAKTRLTEAFKALSGDALKTNNQAFLELAKQSFEALMAEAKGDVGKRQEAIDAVIKPLSESLQRYEQHVGALEKSRIEAYSGLQEHLKTLGETQQQLQKETGNLVSALRNPQVRGRWGEVTLRRVVELAGMSKHCDYVEQVSVDSGEGLVRPDMVVHLPSDREIVVDSKVSLDAYLQAISAEGNDERSKYLQEHAQQIRAHMLKLSEKQYWEQFEKAPEFVVMFIPGESFFAAALESDKSLLEDGMRRKVIPATPTTLIALMLAVAYGWRHEIMAENAQAVASLGKELYQRIKVFRSHLVNLGTGLNRANQAFNKAVGSLELRVLTSARRFQDLGVVQPEEISSLEPLDVTPRALGAQDVAEDVSESAETAEHEG